MRRFQVLGLEGLLKLADIRPLNAAQPVERALKEIGVVVSKSCIAISSAIGPMTWHSCGRPDCRSDKPWLDVFEEAPGERQLHKRLHTHLTQDEEQVDLNEKPR